MLTLALMLAQTVAATPSDTVPVKPIWIPHRVYNTAEGRWTGFEEMARQIATADVAFFGEQHDDPGTHALQRALLESISRRRSNVVLSMEMFERDVQPFLGGYLSGALPEDSLLVKGRPWPNYQTDYRPAVEWARGHGWPVIAANVPRPIAHAVSVDGMSALDSLPSSERGWFARELICGQETRYFEKFDETMREHVPGKTDSEKDDAMARFYLSQCLKDETMAESIILARETSMDSALVVHLNGAFHSDEGLGTAERVRRRAASLKIVVISAIPITNLDEARPSADDKKLGDWLIYTLRP